MEDEEQKSIDEKVIVRGKILTSVDQGILQGYLLDQSIGQVSEKDLPPIKWEGGKLPAKLFRQMLAFFVWVDDTHKCEAVTRLYYNTVTEEWACLVLPQKITGGLHASELDKHADVPILVEEVLNRGFDTWGTAHSHQMVSAFQSGPDEKDERTDVGLHYTVGKFGEASADIHCRFTSFGLCYTITQDEWIEPCEDLLSLSDLPDFPEEWKGRLLKVEPTKIVRHKPPQRQVSYKALAASQLAAHERYNVGPGLWAEEEDEGYRWYGDDEEEDSGAGVFLIDTDDPDDIVRDVCASVLDARSLPIDEVITQLTAYLIMAAHTKQSIERGLYSGLHESVPEILEDAFSDVTECMDEFSSPFLSICGARLLKGTTEIRGAIEEELTSGPSIGDLIDGGYFSQYILDELNSLSVFATAEGYGIASAPPEFKLDEDSILSIEVPEVAEVPDA